MTNEMKLLMAFIEASGFDVESIQDRKEMYNIADCIDGEPKENALPASIIMTTEYKVTKKGVDTVGVLKRIMSDEGALNYLGTDLYEEISQLIKP